MYPLITDDEYYDYRLSLIVTIAENDRVRSSIYENMCLRGAAHAAAVSLECCRTNDEVTPYEWRQGYDVTSCK